ncbi:hypothetical protein E24_00167 [Faustovirus]|nr:hypothetical protein PRJ_Fausto_00152 [Faustovirus]AMN83098.1 hypothetical protein E24_00167 [Faustovirus]AMN84079.1 hypothetical protein D5a_00165 [Faustovirus]AMN85067.1 hypothetical protein E23_00166 [Faustovirus]QBR99065.1 hypothetical protein [Faustovirus mariensis]
MDSFSFTFDIKGMINGKYVLVAAAAAFGVSYVAMSAKEIIMKYLTKSQPTPPQPQSQPPPLQPNTLSSNIIEDYKML